MASIVLSIDIDDAEADRRARLHPQLRQVVADIFDLIEEAYARKLTANRTYYVRADGSDSNEGLSNTAAGAFRTLQKALDVYSSLDLGGYAVTVQCPASLTVGGSLRGNPRGASNVTPLTILGDATTPANCVISTTSANCLTATDGAKVYIIGFELRTTTGGDCLQATRGGQITYGNIRFGACAAFHKEANDHGRIYNNGNYSIVGGAVAHEHCNNLSYILSLSCTVTISGTPAFSSYFAGISMAMIQYVAVVFSGSATGARYLVHENGLLWTNGQGTSFLPGDSAGTAATGGVYT